MIKGYSGLAERYGRNRRTAKRWDAAGLLPPPDAVVCNTKYWHPRTLAEHDRQRAAEALSQPRRPVRPLPDRPGKLEAKA
jgi:hypothetical protein